MNKTLNKNDKGFTIIEVVLVLAIAGLIFLIVFLALPQLQASRRDTQRKNDAGRLLAALENWAGNHSGNYPDAGSAAGEVPGTSNTDWTDDNIAGQFSDPQSSTSGYNFESAYADVDAAGDVYYQKNGVCNATADGVSAGGGDRDVAVVVQLENGQYCQDNQ